MLKLSHVKKTFNKGTVTEKRALTGVDLTLNDGDFVTVIGGNGAGKSTLLNMIAGVYPLDSGVIELDGTDISRLSESQRAKYLGRVFQDPMRGTAADMQIAENLALAKRRGQRRGLSWGVTKAEKDEYVELLKRLDLGLDTRLNAKVGLLSGGQRQALTLLMATLTRPRLLLLDEHTAALDPKTASKVLNLTEEIVDENHLTTLMVTHNMNDAIRLGNRLIMMHEGHVIYDVAGDEKKSLTVADLLQKFEEVSGGKRQNRRKGTEALAAVFAYYVDNPIFNQTFWLRTKETAMKRLPRFALAAALFAGALAGIPSLAFAGNLPAAIDGSVAVMHTNDIHGSYKYSYNASKGTGTVGFDGLAVLYSAQSSVPDLLLDAGDTFHGQSFATMSEGKSIAELMDTFYADGYDATTPGNHDWSYGADKLRTMTGYSTTGTPFAMLCANATSSNGVGRRRRSHG